jgi:hypothetical protein
MRRHIQLPGSRIPKASAPSDSEAPAKKPARSGKPSRKRPTVVESIESTAPRGRLQSGEQPIEEATPSAVSDIPSAEDAADEVVAAPVNPGAADEVVATPVEQAPSAPHDAPAAADPTPVAATPNSLASDPGIG